MRHTQHWGGGSAYPGPGHPAVHLCREHSRLCISLIGDGEMPGTAIISDKPGKLQQSEGDERCQDDAIVGLIFLASWKTLTPQDGNVPHLTNHQILAHPSSGVRGATTLFMRLSSTR